ncbi:MAG: hypothetical protein HXY40_17315 [Chloroflexi bacterium]|nr:hypothetical protein [Chloroflexota bacterium]
MVRKVTKRLMIVSVWVLVSLLLLEAALRLAVPVLPARLAAAARQVLTGRAYVEGYSNAWEYDDEHFYIVRPNLDNVLQYGSPTVSFHLTTYPLWGSRMGFRLAQPDVNYFVDAVFVGDSHTFCFTELADCWVTILGRESGMGTVNLGQPVTGSLSHLAYLEGFAAPLTPPLVIWQFVGNDFNDDYGLLRLRGAIPEAPVDLSLYPPAPQPPQLPPVQDWLQRNSVLYGMIQMLTTGRAGALTAQEMMHADPYTITYRAGVLQFGRWIERMVADMSYPPNAIGYGHTRAALIQAQQRVAAWGGRLLVLLVPTRELVYQDLTAPILGASEFAVWGSAHNAMLQLCAELDLECFDALPGLRQHAQAGEHLYWTDDPHLNPQGNATLAELVRAYLGR